MNPIFANETAKFAVIVDFPTPPFPEATAIIFEIPGIAFPFIKLGFSAFSGASTLILTLTLAFSYTFSWMTLMISTSARFFMCSAGVANNTSTTTSSPNVITF